MGKHSSFIDHDICIRLDTTMRKMQRRKPNSVRASNDHTHGKLSKSSVAFFHRRLHPGARVLRFLMLRVPAKTKILAANKSRAIERYICRTTVPSESPLTPDIAAKFRWDGHLQDISVVLGIPVPSRCSYREKVSSGLRRGRFPSRCLFVKWLFGVRASRRMTLHSALTSYRCGSLWETPFTELSFPRFPNSLFFFYFLYHAAKRISWSLSRLNLPSTSSVPLTMLLL